jgi:putative transposase
VNDGWGNNREACFYAPEDYQIYLEILTEVLWRYGVRLHAYVLMTNHVHWLMTPRDRDGISNVTKVLGSG